MTIRYTREVLYEKVWNEPLRTLAPKIGVSDTALRNACKRASIPLPHQGHWAKKRAGKRLTKIKLPLRFPGASNIVKFGNRYASDWPKITLNTVLPPPPEFDETIEDLRNRVADMVGKVTYPQTTTKTHPIIQKFLDQDEERQKEYVKHPYSWYAPRFDTPIEKRRLRILNAIFLATTRLGCKPDMSISKYADDNRESFITVGNQRVSFTLQSPDYKTRKKQTQKSKRQPLELVIPGGYREAKACLHWIDQDESRLENHLSEIVIELIAGAAPNCPPNRDYLTT
ncbi:MAG: hypothetical protein ABW090_01250 [Sedimenticola sp.]